MVKHNNVIPNGHFKHWQNYVKTWFNQPARKTRRRNARQKKAVKIFPRTTAVLCPVVHGQTLKYNMKEMSGKGFSLEELKAAGIPKKLAPTIGIAVHRRRNRSMEGIQRNVLVLKTWSSSLDVFTNSRLVNLLLRSWRNPLKSKVLICLSPREACCRYEGVQCLLLVAYMPITREKPAAEFTKLTADLKAFTNKRHLGARLKKAAEAEKEEKK